MSEVVGLRVVRGPHWQWESQDGGEGGLGTVVSANDGSSSSGKAVVRWDNGELASYRMGEDSAYDLRIIDNATRGTRHTSISCDACNEKGILGIRWKCKICNNYDLCMICYMSDKHDITHAFLRIAEPSSPAIVVPPRESSFKIDAKGVCPGAIVTRGCDWKWGDQDGGEGQTGMVTEVLHWPGNSYRSAVGVLWSATGNMNTYRFGFEGKLDVVATTCQQAGKYYPEHLPNLGEPAQKVAAPSNAAPGNIPFRIGDRVRITVPVHVLRELQADHGGWIPEMNSVVEKIGTVRGFTKKGHIRVEFDSNKKYSINPMALKKFTKASVGDIVRIISDCATAKARQKGRGPWSKRMTQALGKLGKVMAYAPNGDLIVDIDGSAFTWNPECCTEPSNADKDLFAAAASASGSTSPVLNNAHTYMSTTFTRGRITPTSFSVGDVVTIMNDKAKVKTLQESHGGWNDTMVRALGKTGQVVGIDVDGDAIVRVAGRKWTFNPDCCTLVTESERPVWGSDSDSDFEGARYNTATFPRVAAEPHGPIRIGMYKPTPLLQRRRSLRFGVGDIVQITGDAFKVKALQWGHGGWNDLMLLALGRAGQVTAIDYDGNVCVLVGGIIFTFNQDCLKHVTASEAMADDCLFC